MSRPFAPKDGFRLLTRAEVEVTLHDIDMAPSAAIMRRADQLSGDLNIEGRDLLQSAIVGALTSRSCRNGIDGGQFLAGIMRSIASTARRARERRGEIATVLPVDVLTEQLAAGRYTAVTAEDILETERIRRLCEGILDNLAAASPRQAALIDGIGLGLRGKALARHLGISPDDLATVRRSLKRHAERLWEEADEAVFRPASG